MASEGPVTARALGLFRYFTRHRTAANLLLALMLAAGLAALPRMNAQFFPDVVVNTVSVRVAWAGAGAADVDAAIVQIIEPALLAIDGVASTSASASEGRAVITVEFDPGHDVGQGASDVQDAVDALTTLPDEAEAPVVTRGSWRDRVTNVVVAGPVGIDQLALFTDELVTRLFDAGITRATIQGIAAPEISVEVPTMRLVQHDISLAAIAQAIATEVGADPSGALAGGAQRVRTGSERRSAEDIRAIVLRSAPGGGTLTIGDVAEVRDQPPDRNRAYFVGQEQAIVVRIDRAESGDAIAMQRDVERVAADMMLSLPPGVRVELVNARAEAISGRLNILLVNGAQGLALVLVLLFLFLNAHTAFWVAAGIPASMMTAVAVMYLTGMSLNMISLFALIITLGIVVDDAIVVGEHADYRFRTLGEPPSVAAENAATRMGMDVLAATLTTIIAFGGLLVISGSFGNMLADIPWTVIAVLSASLVECFLILPNHMAHSLASTARERWYDWPSRQVNRGFDVFKRVAFRPFMRGVITARYAVLAAALALVAWSVTAILSGQVTWRFFSSPEQGTLTGNFVMTAEATRDDTLAMMRELQRASEALATRLEAEHGTWPIASSVAEIGGNAGRPLAAAENSSPDQLGALTIDLINADHRPYSSFEFTSMLQDEVRPHPLLEELSFRSFGMGPGGDSLSVDLIGTDAEALKAAAEALKAALATFAEVTGLEDTLAYDKEELVLELTAQGQALGFSPDALARELRQRLSGIEAATFPDGVRSASIRVELPEHERAADFLDNTLLRSADGRYLPLGDIVTVQTRQGFSTIRRENGLQLVTVSGVLDEGDPAAARAVIDQLDTVILPRLTEDHGVTYRLSGLSEQEDTFLTDALLGLAVCLGGIYLCLAWVFSSWLRPLVVMAVIPFGIVGVIWGHIEWSMAMSMFSIVGLIGMAGIIINDSIVLVSTVDDYSPRRGLIPAIVDAASDRLRPIFLTTATTVLGLAPLLFERSNDAQFLRPTVLTLAYGLGFGMLLVLLVVPSLLAIGHDFERMARSLRRALGAGRAGPLRLTSRAALLWVGAAFALSQGWTLVTGDAGPLTRLLMPQPDSGVAALAAFLLVSAAGLLALWLVAAGAHLRRNRRQRPLPPG